MRGNIRFVSAGAGSGKTTRLIEELEARLVTGLEPPAGIVVTTFTRRAAAELQDRVRQKLVSAGSVAIADQIGQARIGTVNSVCGELLQRFAFEAGRSPEQKVADEVEAGLLFGAAMESALGEDPRRIRRMNALARRLQLVKNDRPVWRDEVKKVVDAARSNGFTPEELRGFGRESAETLLAYFPPATTRDLAGELIAAVDGALSGTDLDADRTKGTSQYVELLGEMRRRLGDGALTWADWVKLSKAKPTARSLGCAERVWAAAGEFERHPRLHQDIQEFSGEIFAIAAASLSAYQTLKAHQRVMDFVDQEQLLLRLLDDPEVVATLGEELELLLVDEFQDTSPIQLALFVKLAAVARETVWVGDLKQSIYGFRGADPQLMESVLLALLADGRQPDVLGDSWRSRPALVHYVNDLFAPAFASNLEPARVVLNPRRPERLADTALAHWRLSGRNKKDRARALAKGVLELVSGGYRVVDKHTRRPRRVAFGDIAVLCRTNENLAVTAGEFAAAGIPVDYSRCGLLATPEGALAMACLRRLADPGDTLASAEIRVLSGGEPAEDWLCDRLRYLAGGQDLEWGESEAGRVPALAALKDARASLPYVTPQEALQLALSASDARGIVSAWGPEPARARHRLNNLDQLVELAARYESHCETRNIAATLSGLILWLSALGADQADEQSEARGVGAVQLLTHHGAKGLEWPVVILMDTNDPVKTRLWGLTAVPRAGTFDMERPLAGRRLRYWPWPFGQQSTGIPVNDAIMTSAAGRAAQRVATEETKRLLYVSFTRARDLLVIATASNGGAGGWLGTLGADWMLPVGEQMALPASDVVVLSECRLLEPPDSWPSRKEAYAPRWYASAEVSGLGMLPYRVTPSAVAPVDGAGLGERVSLGERVELSATVDVTALGNALHGLIACEIRDPRGDRLGRAARILAEHGEDRALCPQDAIDLARRFVDFVRRRYQPVAWHVEHPVRYRLPTGQFAQGFIDLLVETGAGWVVFDHKSSVQPRSQREQIAAGYSGQLMLYKQAVEAASAKPVLATWLHFPVWGECAELRYGRRTG